MRGAIYLGPAMKFEVLLASGTPVVARSAMQDRPFGTGARVEPAWVPKNGKPLSDDGSVGGH